jgi:hypothetical protein
LGGVSSQAALVAEWNFDGQSLNNDVAGVEVTRRLIHRTGTTNNTTPIYTSDTPTGTGYALDLSGDLDHAYALGSDDGYYEPSNMTYAAWVKIDGWNAADNQWNTIFSKQTATTGLRMTRIATQDGTGTDFIPAGGNNIARDTAPLANLTNSVWHHVAFTYDSSSSNLVYYIDGVAEASITGAVYLPNATLLTIDAWNTAGIRGANGVYDTIQIYDTALSASEIEALATIEEEPAAGPQLIGEWNFDDLTVNDTVSGITNRGIYRVGGTETDAVFSSDSPLGEGYALDLTTDTSHMYILNGNDGTGWLEPSNFTYSVWVKANGWTAADNQWNSVFSKQDGTAGGFRLTRIATTDYTGVDFLGTGASQARDTVDQVDVADNAWHHLAFTYDGTTSNLNYYIDGVLRKSATSAYNPAASTHLVVGAWNTAGIRSINGLIDEMKVFNGVLSAAEIHDLANPEEVLFFDDFDSANGTSLYDPAGRATGTLSNLVKYAWTTGTNDVVVDGTLNWDANGDADSNNEQPADNGQQLFRFASSTNTGFFNWYPYVGGEVWDLEYDILTGNSQTLGLGLSDITRNGTLKTYDDVNYDFGMGNFGVNLRYDTDDDAGADLIQVNNIFPSRTNVYNIRIRFHEPLGKATVYVDGTQVAETTNLDFEADARFISWGEATKYGGYIDNVKISLPVIIVNVEPFDAIPAVDLVSNGDFSQVANQTGTAHASRQWNINGTFGDFSAFWGLTADVPSWAPYYADPNGLTANIGAPHADDGGVPVLDGTFYLDTLIDDDDFTITINSSMDYKNGLIQSNILNGATINSAATYQLLIDAFQSNAGVDNDSATFTLALTTGSGSNATNPATAVTGSLLSTAVTNLPLANASSSSGIYQTNFISGADLLAAQSAGDVNVIFEQVNTEAIAGYPTSPNPTDATQVSQVRIADIQLTVVVPHGDVNKDGVVDANDVNLAQLYLDGDGGDSATNRQNTLINDYGFTPADALVYLNLSEFDIDGDDYFDAADITALEALLASPVIDSITIDGLGHVSVEVSGLTVGTQYYLEFDTDLTDVPVFDVTVDSVIAGSSVETFTDTNGLVDQAFYRVTD